MTQSPRAIRNAWLRNIRKTCREWAENYQPREDIVPFEQVKDALFAHLQINSKENFDWILKESLFAELLTWDKVKRDVIIAFERRGYRLMPSANGGSTLPIASKYTLTRFPTEADSPEYIEMVLEQLGVKEYRQAKTVANMQIRLIQTRNEVLALEGWVKKGSDKETLAHA